MKKFKKYMMIMAFVMAFTLLGGCGSKGNSEKWAYIHDPGEEVIELSDNGHAEYKGEKYTFTKDDQFITLTAAGGDQMQLRYVMNGDQMTLYEKSTYTFSGEKNTDGIVGVWLQDNGWSYQFTEDGAFSEENIFFGHYTVDEANSCIRLMYSDPIEDAYLYYTLDGNKLTIDYPWPMVKMGS